MTSKESGRAYAVKIFDKTKPNASIVAMLNEVDTLNMLKDAPNGTLALSLAIIFPLC